LTCKVRWLAYCRAPRGGWICCNSDNCGCHIYVYTNMNTQTCTHKSVCLHADSEERGACANASPLISHQTDRKAADNKSRKSEERDARQRTLLTWRAGGSKYRTQNGRRNRNTAAIVGLGCARVSAWAQHRTFARVCARHGKWIGAVCRRDGWCGDCGSRRVRRCSIR